MSTVSHGPAIKRLKALLGGEEKYLILFFSQCLTNSCDGTYLSCTYIISVFHFDQVTQLGYTFLSFFLSCIFRFLLCKYLAQKSRPVFPNSQRRLGQVDYAMMGC